MRRLKSLRSALPALLIGATAFGTGAYAQQDRGSRDFLVCYRLSGFNEVYKLDIKPHSRLSEKAEERAFKHPRQYAYSVIGKHVGTCGPGTVRPVDGALISTVPVGQPGGARFGLESFNTTDVPNTCRDVEISCKSTGKGFPPSTWDCFGQNKFDVEFQFTLERVREDKDQRCSLFEDGTRAVRTTGEGSGTRKP